MLDHSVLINGLSLSITKNLAEAISALRELTKVRTLFIWADAICVNQSDTVERSLQVRLMTAIYRCAECVVIWLGGPTNDSDFVMDEMVKWEAWFDQIMSTCGNDYSFAVASMLPTDPIFLEFDRKGQGRAWKALDLLLDRAWWTRAWVVQESSLLGPNRTYIACGNRMVDWKCLRATLTVSHHISRYYT